MGKYKRNSPPSVTCYYVRARLLSHSSAGEGAQVTWPLMKRPGSAQLAGEVPSTWSTHLSLAQVFTFHFEHFTNKLLVKRRG